METTEIKNLEYFKQLTARYFHTLKSDNDKTEPNTAQIKFVNYCELGCVITDMLKLCILALDEDAPKLVNTNKSQAINVGLILETVLQLFPLDEFEFLSEVSRMLFEDSQHVSKLKD
ncbi:hypothetical protein [Flavobacterium chilense]|uniref:Uncharacterized protein n=1 Tax=Flavobacterium chilense TaxID=946677 RepID=A0A1M6X7S4_9FLAO|nr:hypothetical protein [Flavobacterium chilense]SHL01973.1 hypothetical protein SAMN05444484_10131 [Flavobacterium chilense]